MTPSIELNFDEISYDHVFHNELDCHSANMDYDDLFPDISPMDEILERDFSSDVCSPDWSQNHRLGDLVSEEKNIENILLQTTLDFDAFETESTTSSEPQSPANFQVCNDLFTDEELINISIRVLNKRLKDLPKSEAKTIRKRRRSLKNRGYATTCRQKRTALKESLEQQNQRLKMQLQEAKQNLCSALKDRDMFKRKYENLQNAVSTRYPRLLEKSIDYYLS